MQKRRSRRTGPRWPAAASMAAGFPCPVPGGEARRDEAEQERRVHARFPRRDDVPVGQSQEQGCDERRRASHERSGQQKQQGHGQRADDGSREPVGELVLWPEDLARSRRHVAERKPPHVGHAARHPRAMALRDRAADHRRELLISVEAEKAEVEKAGQRRDRGQRCGDRDEVEPLIHFQCERSKGGRYLRAIRSSGRARVLANRFLEVRGDRSSEP